MIDDVVCVSAYTVVVVFVSAYNYLGVHCVRTGVFSLTGRKQWLKRPTRF